MMCVLLFSLVKRLCVSPKRVFFFSKCWRILGSMQIIQKTQIFSGIVVRCLYSSCLHFSQFLCLLPIPSHLFIYWNLRPTWFGMGPQIMNALVVVWNPECTKCWCYLGPSPWNWRTMINWNIVPPIFHNDHICQGKCKNQIYSDACIVNLSWLSKSSQASMSEHYTM